MVGLRTLGRSNGHNNCHLSSISNLLSPSVGGKSSLAQASGCPGQIRSLASGLVVTFGK